MNITEIRKMSVVERIKIMEVLWDSLLYEEFDIESPKWHHNILENRIRKIESGEAEFITIKELKDGRRNEN